VQLRCRRYTDLRSAFCLALATAERTHRSPGFGGLALAAIPNSVRPLVAQVLLAPRLQLLDRVGESLGRELLVEVPQTCQRLLGNRTGNMVKNRRESPIWGSGKKEETNKSEILGSSD
jgi:hypothetical protein